MKKRRIAVSLAVMLLVSMLVMPVEGTAAAVGLAAPAAELAQLYPAEEGSYGAFLTNIAYPDRVGESLILTGEAAKAEEKSLMWAVTAPATGRYYVQVRYKVATTVRGQLEYSLYVNGKIPYDELEGFVLPREYVDSSAPVKDIYGNEIRPTQTETDRETENYLFDYAGMYAQPLSINLEAGVNTLTLTARDTQAEIRAVTLVPAGEISDYATYAQKHADKADYTGKPIYLEAEDTAYKSDQTLYGVGDKSSPLVSPTEVGKIRLNTVGGYRWNVVGQYIAWNITVPKSGLYTLAFKVRQNVNSGQKSGRLLMVNGEIPFREAGEITVPYSTKWQMLVPGNEDGAYRVYLEAGENELRLQATLGGMDEVLRSLDSAVKTLNAIYRKLLVIIGVNPDTARDYKLDKLVPEQLEEMKRQAAGLAACANHIESFNESSNAGVGLLRTMERQLIEMSEDSDKVAENFSYFKTNIGALGTWLATAKQQPLAVDYLGAGRAGEEWPAANAGWFAQFIFDVGEFAGSFVADYRSIGQLETAETDKALKVWMSTGRDQAQSLRSMIGDSFTPQQGIRVQLELVTAGTLLPAIVAGTGPDVNIGSTDVVNYAMRNAVYDLAQFDDFEEIATRFSETLFIPLRYMGGVYGLPENVDFSVLFYRTDIFEELNLQVPETWDDVRAISSVLSKNNMEFGLPSGNGSYLMLLRQRDIPIYEADGISCALDQVDAIRTFEEYTNLYVNYGLPLSFDFVNRFRSGEMPVGVASFGVYNSLQVAAPEIKGLWSMAKVPGSIREDGSVDHTTMAGGSAVMIIKNSEEYEAGWEFLKWWTSADVQVRYGREMESVLGPSGRYTSANSEAFALSSWPREELTLLTVQMAESSALEQVPGGYFLSRHLDNAFRNVVYSGKEPMDMLYDYVYKIDRELTEKRQEFGLPVAE